MKSDIVCYCSNVSKGEIEKALKNGAKNISDIRKMTGACTLARCAELNPKGKCCSSDIISIIDNFNI